MLALRILARTSPSFAKCQSAKLPRRRLGKQPTGYQHVWVYWDDPLHFGGISPTKPRPQTWALYVVGTSNSVPEIAMDWSSLHQNLHDWVFHDWVFHPVTNHTHPFPQIKSIRTAPIYQNQWLPQGGKLVVRPLCLPKLPTLYVDVCSGINPDWFPSAHEWWITPIAKVILSRWNWTLAVHFLEKIAPRKRWPEKWRSSSICWILEFPIDLRFQRYGFETKCLLPWLRSTWDGQSHCLHLQGQAHYFLAHGNL